MTNEEIDAEIKRLTALKKQNDQTQIIGYEAVGPKIKDGRMGSYIKPVYATESNKPADGIYNPADYIGQIANKMNDQSRNRGDQFSNSLEVIKDAGRRTGFEQDTDGTPLPETAYDWVVQQVNAARARGPVSKYTLKAIENGAKVRYNVPSNFNISGPSGIVGFLNGSTERNMAKAMNSMPYNGKTQKPAQNSQNSQNSQNTQPAQNPQTAQNSQNSQNSQNTQPAQSQDISPKTKLDDDRTAAYKRIKSKQASDADLAMFKDYTEEQLKNIGFGPVSIKAIKDVAGIQSQQTSNGLTDDDKQFMQQYKQYTQQLSGSQPRNQAALKAMQESDAHKFVTDPVNKERYNKLSGAQEATKKTNKNAKKIEQLKQQLDIHKKIMAENPDRPDIQSAQQMYIDNITKDIQKLGGSVE